MSLLFQVILMHNNYIINNMEKPKGLSIFYDVISIEKENEIIKYLDSNEWSNDFSRRTQQYGYSYDYRCHEVKKVNPMTNVIYDIANMISDLNIMKPEQCIVNEYLKNQGIIYHIYGLKFGNKIVGLSIGSDDVMYFKLGKNIYECFVPKRSLVIIEGDARYKWTHSIKGCDYYYDNNGSKIYKSDDHRRISLTYRELNLKYLNEIN